MDLAVSRKTMRTERLTVRPVEAEDWKSIREIWRDFEKTEYRIYDTPKSTAADDVKRRIARWAAASQSGNEHVFFAVCLEDKPIGFISLNARAGGYELGYGFLNECHGKGYAKESLTAVLELARELGAKKVFAGTAMKNLPSAALLKSLGFRLAGTETVSFFKDAEGNDICFEGGKFEKEL